MHRKLLATGFIFVSLPLPPKTTAGSVFVHESEVCQTKQQNSISGINLLCFVMEERIYIIVLSSFTPTICT